MIIEELYIFNDHLLEHRLAHLSKARVWFKILVVSKLYKPCLSRHFYGLIKRY